MMERRVLILINGENDAATLSKLSLCDDIDTIFERLLELELIEVAETTPVERESPAGEADSVIDVHAVSAREFMCNTLQTFGNRVRIADLNNQIAEAEDLDSLKQLVKPWYQSISDTPGGMYQADDLRREVLELMHNEELKGA